MLQQLIKSSQPVFALLLCLLVIPALWFFMPTANLVEHWLLAILFYLVTLVFVLLPTRLYQKTELSKNCVNAAAFSFLIAVLMVNYKGFHWREMLFLAAVLLSIFQGLKVYKEAKPGARYLSLGLLASFQFILLPAVGVLSLFNILPFVLFGVGLRGKNIMAYLFGILLCMYLYYSASYLFNFSNYMYFENPFSRLYLLRDIKNWLGTIALFITGLLVAFPGYLSTSSDLSVEKRFYKRLLAYFFMLCLIQGFLLTLSNPTPKMHVIALLPIVALLTPLFAEAKRAWPSLVLFSVALLVFVVRNFYL